MNVKCHKITRCCRAGGAQGGGVSIRERVKREKSNRELYDIDIALIDNPTEATATVNCLLTTIACQGS